MAGERSHVLHRRGVAVPPRDGASDAAGRPDNHRRAAAGGVRDIGAGREGWKGVGGLRTAAGRGGALDLGFVPGEGGLAFADMVVLNKVDLVGPEHVEVIHEWIGAHLKRIRIVEARHGDVPLEILLAVGRFDPEHVINEAPPATPDGHIHHHHADGGHMFETWSYETERPFSLAALEEAVRRELPGSIYRCKGIIHVADAPDRRYALQAVGRRTEVTDIGAQGDAAALSRIVAIGSKIDTDALTRLFEGCLADAV